MDEVAEVVSGGTPPRGDADGWGGGIPWLTPSEVTRLAGRTVDSTNESITETGAKRAGLTVLPPGAVILTTRATIGAVARVGTPLTTNQGFQNLVPRQGVDGGWLYYSAERASAELQRLAGGSTFKEVSRQSVRGLGLLLPPLTEQRAIAAVLDAVDDTIERTEAVIAATEELRSALLHELLTRGVRGWHSEWKHVPGLGTVPACWDVTTLGDATAEVRYGTSVRLSPEGAWPVLRIPNAARGVINTADLKYADLSEHEARTLSLEEGDLLIVRTNGNPEICGASAVFEGLEGRYAFASYLLRLRVHRERVDSTYLWTYLRSGAGRRQLGANIRTSAGNYNLSAEGLGTILLPLPPIDEQRRIAAAVHALAVTLTTRQSALSEMKRAKNSLADALLTGRVRMAIRSAK